MCLSWLVFSSIVWNVLLSFLRLFKCGPLPSVPHWEFFSRSQDDGRFFFRISVGMSTKSFTYRFVGFLLHSRGFLNVSLIADGAECAAYIPVFQFTYSLFLSCSNDCVVFHEGSAPSSYPIIIWFFVHYLYIILYHWRTFTYHSFFWFACIYVYHHLWELPTFA